MRYRISAFIVIVFCLLLLAAGRLHAQTMTPAQWAGLKNDKAFSYKNDREKIERTKEYKPGALEKFVSAFLSFLGGDLGNLLVWVLVILAVTYVIYRVAFGGGVIFAKGGKRATGIPLEAETEDVSTTDWEALLQRAVAGSDFRLAIRYSYMWLLQLLQQQQLIQYQQGKTNYEYYGELRDTPYKQPFRQLSRVYEYAWYGQYPIQPVAYSEYIAIFNTVKQELNR